jgi:hypothetical protein
MHIARLVAIWALGLLAGAIIGGAIGVLVKPYGGDFVGMIGGMATFACLRLWLSELTENSN